MNHYYITITSPLLLAYLPTASTRDGLDGADKRRKRDRTGRALHPTLRSPAEVTARSPAQSETLASLPHFRLLPWPSLPLVLPNLIKQFHQPPPHGCLQPKPRIIHRTSFMVRSNKDEKIRKQGHNH
ncbi:hypothetical protein J6590_010544 [Homalodisca vitripennis]|nr:hypothetical protein J6590_010544 [Homalodisca vitripennis]